MKVRYVEGILHQFGSYLSLDEVVADLTAVQERAKLGGWVNVTVHLDIECDSVNFTIRGQRPETEAEVARRMKMQARDRDRRKKAKENVEAIEREELTRLKAKYEARK